MIDTHNLIWQDLSMVKSAPINVQLWLHDEHSLTAKLKQQFDDFSLNVLSQQQAQPHAHEAAIIGTNASCIIREVALLGN
ncbi:chorismate--pyruvate lyase family protein, partial [Candidatus Thioglobus sp.]|uniref:chorismate--pyruvate lyase family protein n=1 Tax=Candidatus Thioglobus sp. TaxID=2026721 RepID=UPI003D0A7169